MNNLSTPMPSSIVPVRERQNSYSPESLVVNNPEFISTAELYEAVYDNAFHPMYISGINGKIVKFNEKFSKLFGFFPKEIDKLKAADFFQTNDISFRTFIQNMNDNGIAKAEVTGIKKSGEIFPCRISSVFYQSDKGEKRFMNTLVNISDHISARWNVAG